jgi:YbbR domain-containing protein
MLRWIANNLRTFIWALALAIAVWVAAVTSADPDETRLLPYRVPIERVSQDPGLVISTELPASVELTLRAPRSIWEEIEANPQNVHAILDLSGLDAGEHTKQLQIQVNARPVQIVSMAPDSVTFTLEPLVTNKFKVDLSLTGQPAIGYQVGEAILEPQEIIIAGAKSQVEKVTRVRASVNLDGIRESIEQSVPVEVLDAQGQPATGLTISPDSVYVTLPVSQQGGYRDMAVKVIVTGRVASGYRLTDISVFPPVITVFSTDPELVSKLPGVVETLPLDLQNANDDITTRLALNLPAGVSVVGEQTVLIQAGVSPIESSLTMAGEKVEIVGLPAEFTAQISPEVVDVIVSGPLPLLDTLTRQDLRVAVDLTGLEAGTHQLTPKVEILISDVVVESILPGTIEVVLSPSNTPNPTAVPTPTP